MSNIEKLQQAALKQIQVSIRLSDGHYYDRCNVEGVGETIAMVSLGNSKQAEQEGIILEDIIDVEYLKAKHGAAKAKRMKSAPLKSGKSKKDVALELFDQYPNATRKEAIEMLVEQAGMSKAGASTYYQNIWKAK